MSLCICAFVRVALMTFNQSPVRRLRRINQYACVHLVFYVHLKNS